MERERERGGSPSSQVTPDEKFEYALVSLRNAYSERTTALSQIVDKLQQTNEEQDLLISTLRERATELETSLRAKDAANQKLSEQVTQQEREREKLIKVMQKLQSDVNRLMTFKRAILNTFNDERERSELQGLVNPPSSSSFSTSPSTTSSPSPSAPGNDLLALWGDLSFSNTSDNLSFLKERTSPYSYPPNLASPSSSLPDSNNNNTNNPPTHNSRSFQPRPTNNHNTPNNNNRRQPPAEQPLELGGAEWEDRGSVGGGRGRGGAERGSHPPQMNGHGAPNGPSSSLDSYSPPPSSSSSSVPSPSSSHSPITPASSSSRMSDRSNPSRPPNNPTTPTSSTTQRRPSNNPPNTKPNQTRRPPQQQQKRPPQQQPQQQPPQPKEGVAASRGPSAAVSLFDAARARLSPDAFAQLMGCLKTFADGEVESEAALDKVVGLLEGNEDLLASFRSIIVSNVG